MEERDVVYYIAATFFKTPLTFHPLKGVWYRRVKEVGDLRINEIERLAGVSKRNIRYYESEGLLSPGRETGNGYRDYTEADLETLRQIKLLRKLDLPLEEIRRLQAGALTVADVMGRHVIQLERRQANLEAMAALCRELKEEAPQFAALDGTAWLERMEQREKEGTKFVNIKKKDVKAKYAGAIGAAVVMIALMAALIALFVWAFTVDPAESPPLPLMVVFCAIPAVVVIGILIALVQRIIQIKGGEEDAAADY